MSPLPVRVDTNASDLPSGEKSGRDSVAGFATRRRASPPFEGTVQMSPPETNAIVFPSGESDGSEYGGCVAARAAVAASRKSAARRVCMRAIIASMKFVLLLALLMAGPVEDPTKKTPDQLKKGIENQHPSTYYILA